MRSLCPKSTQKTAELSIFLTEIRKIHFKVLLLWVVLVYYVISHLSLQTVKQQVSEVFKNLCIRGRGFIRIKTNLKGAENERSCQNCITD